jgi:hypothetical protein
MKKFAVQGDQWVYMMKINEIQDDLWFPVKYLVLIVEILSGSYMASNLDNPLEFINGGILIINHVKNPQ